MHRRHLVIAMRHVSKEEQAPKRPDLAVKLYNDQNSARDGAPTCTNKKDARLQKVDFVQPKSYVWRKNGDIALTYCMS